MSRPILILYETCVDKRIRQFTAVTQIVLVPFREMLDIGKKISLLSVTACVREHKIMAEINRVTGPGNEVVQIAVPGLLTAIETSRMLIFPEYGSVSIEGVTLGTEQEFLQSGHFTKNVPIEANVLNL